MKQINYKKYAIGKKKLGKGLRGYKGGTSVSNRGIWRKIQV